MGLGEEKVKALPGGAGGEPVERVEGSRTRGVCVYVCVCVCVCVLEVTMGVEDLRECLSPGG